MCPFDLQDKFISTATNPSLHVHHSMQFSNNRKYLKLGKKIRYSFNTLNSSSLYRGTIFFFYFFPDTCRKIGKTSLLQFPSRIASLGYASTRLASLQLQQGSPLQFLPSSPTIDDDRCDAAWRRRGTPRSGPRGERHMRRTSLSFFLSEHLVSADRECARPVDVRAHVRAHVCERGAREHAWETRAGRL